MRDAKKNKPYIAQESKQIILSEPIASYTSRMRAIGNSKGVILNSQLIETAKLNTEVDIVMQASEGYIVIMQLKENKVNTDLSTWDKQFKMAIKNGAVPDNDMFDGINNEFDKNEW